MCSATSQPVDELEDTSTEDMPYLVSDSDSLSDLDSSDDDSEDGEWLINELRAEELEDSDYDDEEVDLTGTPFTAAAPGRTAESKPPRFDVQNLRPWEVMFADEKSYETTQRGGYTTAFILLEMASDGWFKRDEVSKTQHGKSFESIMVENGVHNLDYNRTIYTDGCGSMQHVRSTAIRMGINHIFIPPHSQSLNEAERVADRAWAVARTHIANTGGLHSHMALAVDHACYMKLRMATTANRAWLTPYEILRGQAPSVSHCIPFFTRAYVLSLIHI